MSHEHLSECPGCTVEPFQRNHYFTGKLLVERDFTDEQRYYVDKLRHHHQRLHGHGVVCGLCVKQQEACGDRMVCVEPGTAIDCCGRDILILEPEHLDFTALPSFKAKIKPGDTEAHVLQICLRYQECPTEDVPVLFDDCGCDDTQCAPNRILESYALDVIVDPVAATEALHTPRLSAHSTTTLARSVRVVHHADSRRLYVIAGETKQTVYQIDTGNGHVIGAHTLNASGLEVAVSNDGARLYVVSEAVSNPSSEPRRLVILDTANNLNNPPISTSPLADSAGSEIFLAVAPAPDNRLLALVGTTGHVWIWPTTLNTAGTAPAPTGVGLGANLRGLVIASDGKHAYTTDSQNNSLPVLEIAPTAVAGATISGLPAGAAPSQLALVASTAADQLAVVSQTGEQLHLIALNPPAPVGRPVRLAHPPVALAVSPGGQWAYVLEQDGTDSYVQAVSLQHIQLNLPPLLSTPFKVGKNSRQIALAPGGDRLYLPFEDGLAPPNGGGVDVVEVSEEACTEILWRHLDGCPDCDGGECVVLATIANYHHGDRIQDPTVPPSDPLADAEAGIARIDNRRGRRLLPSVQTLAELVECLLAEGPGGPGKQGPPGPAGPAGEDGVSVTSATAVTGAAVSATFDDATGNIHFVIPPGAPGEDGVSVTSATAVTGAPVSATFNAATGNIHFVIPPGKPGADGVSVTSATAVTGAPVSATFNAATGNIHFVIPPGADGLPGPGLEAGLTRIKALSWRHNQRNRFNRAILEIPRLRNPSEKVHGIVIGFTKEVDTGAPNQIDADHVFQVLVDHTNPQERELGFFCRCPIHGQILPVDFSDDGNGLITSASEVAGPIAKGIAFVFDGTPVGKIIVAGGVPELWVMLRGDFVVDKGGRAIDAEFVRAELVPPGVPGPAFPGTGDHPANSEFGVQGGLFESWFTLFGAPV